MKYLILVSLIPFIFFMYKLDTFLLPTLDYFGKFVFFGLLNIALFYIFYKSHKLLENKFNLIIANISTFIAGSILAFISIYYL